VSSGRSPEQAIQALDHANKVRIERAKLRLRISAGEIPASRVLADLPECMKGCGAYQFLTFIPYVGRAGRRDSAPKAFVLLRKANAASAGHKRLDQLTPGQLERLTRVVRDYEDARHPAERGIA
jgi:hypothetical protein